jgi:hypothetical protein
VTNQTTPTPFPQFQPTVFNPGAAFDFFQSDAPYVSNRATPGRNRITFSGVPSDPRDPNDWRRYVIRWDLYIEDLSGGLDRMQENIDAGSVSNKLAFAELNHFHPRTLCLLTLEDSSTAAGVLFDISSTAGDGPENRVLHVAFGQTEDVIAGAGISATQALMKLRQSSGAISVTAAAYDASTKGNICSLSQGTINSIVNRLFVGHAKDPAYVVARDGDSTIGAMHANTEPLWWAVDSPLNAATPGATTLIMHSANSIYSLSGTSAVGTAPTKILDDFPNGSYLIGVLEIPGSPIRIYAFSPSNFNVDPSTLTSHVLDNGSPYVGEIVSLNLEGDEPQILDMGIRNLLHAVKIREGIAAHNGTSLVFHNGQKNDLGWGRERIHDSDRQQHIVYLQNVGERLLLLVTETDTDSDIEGIWWEEYDFERQAFYRLTKSRDPGTTIQPILATSGQSAVYHASDREEGATVAHRLYWYDNVGSDGWYSIPLFPSTINPFYWQNLSETIRFFATTGTAKTPVYHFYSGFPKVVSDIWCGGDIRVPSGGAGAKVEVEVALQAGSSMSFGASSPTAARTATFSSADRWDKFTRKWKQGAPEFDRLQLQFWLTQATSGTGATKTTPNALPTRVGGYIFLDGVVRNPIEIDAVRFRDE